VRLSFAALERVSVQYSRVSSPNLTSFLFLLLNHRARREERTPFGGISILRQCPGFSLSPPFGSQKRLFSPKNLISPFFGIDERVQPGASQTPNAFPSRHAAGQFLFSTPINLH